MAFSVTSSGLTPSSTSGAHGVDDLCSTAVVERDGERHRRVRLRELARLVHPLQQPSRHAPVATSDERDAHPTLVQLVAAPRQNRLVEAHEVAHLVDRSAPVLGRERVHGQPAHAELERAVDGVEQSLLTRRVALGARQPSLLRPATVAVHDTRDVRGDAVRIDPFEPASEIVEPSHRSNLPPP